MNTPTDHDLILRARRGQADAFSEIVTKHQTNVFNICYRVLHNRSDAEDLAQETFMRAYDKLHTFDLEREFGPWVRRIAANLSLNFLESQKASTELDDERDQDQSQKPETQVEVKERSEQIREALTSLPSNYRVVIELRHYQEISYDEIAAELKVPLSDVKSYLFRARKLLAEKLHAPD